MSGPLRDLLLWSKSRCFACKNHWWGLGHIETSYSCANHAVLDTQNDRLCLGPRETYNSVILCLQNGVPTISFTSFYGFQPSFVVFGLITGTFGAVLHAQNDRCCLGPIETCYSGPKSMFASKNDRWGLEPIEISNSDARHAVWHAQNHRWRLGPIETCNSCPNVALLNAQNHR